MLSDLSNEELISRLNGLVLEERTALVGLLEHLAEFDERKLYAVLRYPSLFAYCVTELRYSEQATAKRVYTARSVRKYPVILEMLRRAELHMSAVMILGPHLTPDGGVREPSRIPIPAGRQKVEFFAPQRVHFGFNGSEEFIAKYERARELLRHKYPAGKLEDILSDALEALLDKKDPDRWKAARAPVAGRLRSDGRAIPRFVKTLVWARDAGRCVFVGPDGTLCGERGGLEFDHVTPFAFGGRSDDPKNIHLLCRTHNQLAARRIFGEEADHPS